ncbi:MAG: formylmethanofuran dehydrogenase subunit C [Candidatus Hodarchaeales archaeon]|jgi:formylmethanofuran dehydrogenase subunit C
MMKTLELIPKDFELPVDLDHIIPEKVVEVSKKKVAELPIWLGREQLTLGDLFEVKGDVAEAPQEQTIIFRNVNRLMKRIGMKMASGTISVEGVVGDHVGSQMTGGKLIVEGDAGQYAGMEMSGGVLEIKGNAGNYLGAAYWGNWEGMTGGHIVVHGNVGHEAASWMKNGFIEIKGNVGNFLGCHMTSAKALVLVRGSVGKRMGGEMTRGTIVCSKAADILPSFKHVGQIPSFSSEAHDLEVTGPFEQYHGDYAEPNVTLKAKRQGILLVGSPSQ